MSRKKSERKRNAEEVDILSIALEQSANVVVITDPDGNIEYVNKAFSQTTGYEVEEVMGKNPRILKSGFQSKDFYEKLWHTISNGQQWHGEFQNINKFGDTYWENATITPVKNTQGKIIRYIAIKENITSRRIAEDALKQSEEKYRSLIANIPGVIYRCAFDKNWTMNYISNAIEDLTGYKSDDFINNKKRSFSSIIHSDDRERVTDTISIGIESFQQYSIEYRIMTNKNSVRWVSETGRPVYDKDGNIIWLDGVIFDITDRVHVLDELKKAKHSAEQANRAKSEFLANISHEIRTPLNSVLGFTDLLEDTITQETEKQYLEAIKTSGKNLLTLINDLLDLSKIEAGKLTLHHEFVDLKKILLEVKQIFSLRLNQKNLQYYEYIDPAFPAYIYSDESRLRQILINLVGNAVKFTHDGHISVKVEFEQGKKSNEINLKISISDTGIGIPKEAYDIIFESFRQHSRLDTRKYEGTGLGLPITKKLVEALNGSVFFESIVNRGSNFTIVFPGVPVQEDILTSALYSGKKESDKKRDKILLQDFTGRFLSDYRDFMPMYEFIEFFSFYRNPIWQRNEIKAVFVVTGLDHIIINQKLHYFRKHEFLKDLPVILLTETLSDQVHEEAIKIADLIISMPSDISSMMKKITLVLKNDDKLSVIELKKETKDKTNNLSEIKPLITEFESVLFPQWKNYSTKQPLKEIRSFASRIMDIGEAAHIDFLLDYGNGINTSINEFNIEALRERLARFPDIIDQLKKMADESN
ncbi:MAG: PAS domain S-box protein [Bacteroidales bacterium]|nr:PAS domain S-box protein [Bacteroidales bacterium]